MRIKNRVIKYLIAAWVMLYAIPCSSSVAFYHFDSNNGLPETNIISIAQDSTGFIWLAGENSLFRFDGHQFKQYKNNLNNPGESVLPSQKINVLFTDSDGKLWVGSENGILIYNLYFDKFFTPAEEWKNIRVTDFAEDENGNLWIATDAGLALFNKKTNQTEWFTNSETLKTPGNNILPEQNIIQVSYQKNGIIWITTYAGGFFRVDSNNKQISDFTETGATNFSVFKITELHVSGNKVYLSTLSNGLFLLDPEQKTVTNNTFENLGYNIHDFQFFKDSIIWLATNNGLLKYNFQKNHFTRYTNIPTDPLSLNRTAVDHVFIDREDNLWVSSGIRGVNYGLRNVPFRHFIVGEGEPFSLAFKEVTAIHFDHSGNMWLGYESGAVEKHTVSPLDKKTVPLSSTSQKWSPGAVFKIFEDSKNRIWMGGWQSGLQKLNAAGTSFELAQIKPDAMARLLGGTDIRGITEDNSRNLWLSFHGLGIGKYNPQTKNMKLFSFDPENPSESLSNNYTFNIEHDKLDNIWVATSYGVSKIDAKTKKFTNYYQEENNPASLTSSNVGVVFCDSNGLTWAGTSDGLNVYLPKKGTFQPVLTHLESSVRNIAAIAQSRPNEIWVSTQSGLIKVSYKLSSKADSIECSSQLFDRTDGLISTNFFKLSSATDGEGIVYFGGNQGIDIYNPNDDNNFSDPLPETIITEISVYGQPVFQKVQNLSSGIPELELKPSQQMVSFRFSSLDFNNSGNQKYRYMLEGFDNRWVYPQNEQVATYTNLNPGTYLFKVQSQAKDNEWDISQDAVRLKIRTPFWQTTPFIIFITLFIVVVFYLSHRLRNKYILAEQQELEKMIDKRTKELQEKNNELKIANQTKNKFFSIISHDLRGPFSGLLGLLEILAEPDSKMNQEEQQRLIITAKQSAQNTFNLLENLLIWSRTQMKNTTHQPKINDISKLIHKNVELKKELLRQKNIKLQTQIPRKQEGYFDIDKIDTVIRNILNNAIKFTHREGNIKIATKMLNGKEIVVQVADSGIGLTPEETQNLFDIGKNSKNGTGGEKGTGLGLIICRDFVKQNKGRIWASPNKPSGTVFYFTLPANKD